MGKKDRTRPFSSPFSLGRLRRLTVGVPSGRTSSQRRGRKRACTYFSSSRHGAPKETPFPDPSRPGSPFGRREEGKFLWGFFGGSTGEGKMKEKKREHARPLNAPATQGREKMEQKLCFLSNECSVPSLRGGWVCCGGGYKVLLFSSSFLQPSKLFILLVFIFNMSLLYYFSQVKLMLHLQSYFT